MFDCPALGETGENPAGKRERKKCLGGAGRWIQG